MTEQRDIDYNICSSMSQYNAAGAGMNVSKMRPPGYYDNPEEGINYMNDEQPAEAGINYHQRPQYDNSHDISPTSLIEQIPETTIGENVIVRGELEFDRLLRIDGNFAGQLISKGDLIIGPTGVLMGDVRNMGSVLVDGKVVGNIAVDFVTLRANAHIHGDITCKALTVDPTVIIVGKLNINPYAPDKVDENGNPVNGDNKKKKNEGIEDKSALSENEKQLHAQLEREKEEKIRAAAKAAEEEMRALEEQRAVAEKKAIEAKQLADAAAIEQKRLDMEFVQKHEREEARKRELEAQAAEESGGL